MKCSDFLSRNVHGIIAKGPFLSSPPFFDALACSKASNGAWKGIRTPRWPKPKAKFLKAGVLQSGRNSHKLRGAVDHQKRTLPVDAGQGLGRPITSRMTIRNVDARPNPLSCGISRGSGTPS